MNGNLKVDMDSYILWSPHIDFNNKIELTGELATLVKRYNEVATEFFELNAIFEQLWRHQNNRPLWATPDVSKYIKE